MYTKEELLSKKYGVLMKITKKLGIKSQGKQGRLKTEELIELIINNQEESEKISKQKDSEIEESYSQQGSPQDRLSQTSRQLNIQEEDGKEQISKSMDKSLTNTNLNETDSKISNNSETSSGPLKRESSDSFLGAEGLDDITIPSDPSSPSVEGTPESCNNFEPLNRSSTFIIEKMADVHTDMDKKSVCKEKSSPVEELRSPKQEKEENKMKDLRNKPGRENIKSQSVKRLNTSKSLKGKESKIPVFNSVQTQRSGMPNFAKIHEKAFKKMEAIDDYVDRRHIRTSSNQLKPVTNESGGKSLASWKTPLKDSAKVNRIRPPLSSSIKLQSKTPNQSFNRFERPSLSSAMKNSDALNSQRKSDKRPVQPRDHVSHLSSRSRIEDFKKKSRKPVVKDRNELASAQRVHIKGVRTNRRFELQMANRRLNN